MPLLPQRKAKFRTPTEAQPRRAPLGHTFLFMSVLYGTAVLIGFVLYFALNNSLRTMVLMNFRAGLAAFLYMGNIGGLSAAYNESWYNIVFLIITWVVGQSTIGAPIIVLLLFIRGLSLGFALSLTVLVDGLHGAIFDLIGIMPWNILIMGAFIVAASISYLFTRELRTIGFARMSAGLLAAYSGVYVICVGLVLLAGWVEFLIVPRIFAWLG